MTSNTTIYVFNEQGLIEQNELENFCAKFIKNAPFQFVKFDKNEIDEFSTIFKKFSIPQLDFIIYDFGYVMKMEGEIKNAIMLLMELDNVIEKSITLYVSPSQRIENVEEYIYPRGSSALEVAQFLDRIFCNNEYTSAIKS